MIHHLNGRLIEKNPSFVVIECNGVGYYINISLHTYEQLGNDEACKLFTHLQVREDAHTLYGFAEKEERELFRHLISVSGVGASTAQMMLSSYTPVEITKGIVNEDVNFLKSIKGIGAKTAQRVIIDLKDKLAKEEFNSEISFSQYNTNKDEALSALIALGFDKKKSNQMLDKLLTSGEDWTVEGLVKAALKKM